MTYTVQTLNTDLDGAPWDGVAAPDTDPAGGGDLFLSSLAPISCSAPVMGTAGAGVMLARDGSGLKQIIVDSPCWFSVKTNKKC